MQVDIEFKNYNPSFRESKSLQIRLQKALTGKYNIKSAKVTLVKVDSCGYVGKLQIIKNKKKISSTWSSIEVHDCLDGLISHFNEKKYNFINTQGYLS